MVSYGFAQMENTHQLGNTKDRPRMPASTNLWVAEASAVKDTLERPNEDAGKYLTTVNVSDQMLPSFKPDVMTVAEHCDIQPRLTDGAGGYWSGKVLLCGTWTSADESIAKGGEDGRVIGVKAGEVETTFTTLDNHTLPKPVTFTVTANPITSVADPEGVTTESGTAPTLPDTVTATFEDGSTGEIAVTWQEVAEEDYSGREGGTFTVQGTATDLADPVAIRVTVNPATITGVDPQNSAVTTESGTAPTLPGQVDATWSNGDVTEEPVTWDEVAEGDYASPGSFSVNGTVADLADSVSVAVTVTAASITAVVPEQTSAAVASGQGYGDIPDGAEITWNNGEITEGVIAWDDFDREALNAREGGEIVVAGYVDGWDEPLYSTITVEPATPDAADLPPDVTTNVGMEPKLARSTIVHWSNGEDTEELIEWAPIEPAHYSEAGTFVATGTVQGLDIT